MYQPSVSYEHHQQITDMHVSILQKLDIIYLLLVITELFKADNLKFKLKFNMTHCI